VEVRNGVDEDERLLSRLGLDVFEQLLLDVVKDLAVSRQFGRDGLRHTASSVGWFVRRRDRGGWAVWSNAGGDCLASVES
jgi:hypothetical protein